MGLGSNCAQLTRWISITYMLNQPSLCSRKFSLAMTVLLLSLVAALQSGCASHNNSMPEPQAEIVPEMPATQFQPSLGRVALIVKVDLPELYFMRIAGDKDRAFASGYRSAGSTGCGSVDIGACLLGQLVVGAVIGTVQAVSASNQSDKARDAEAVMAPVLGSTIIQDGLRDAIMAAAQAEGVSLTVVPPVAVKDGDTKTDYSALAATGVDTVLEVTLKQVFYEPGYDRKPNLDPVLPLDMRAHIRLVKTRDTSPVFFDDFAYHGKRFRYTEWGANNAGRLTKGLEKGYEILGRDITDRVFMLFPFADRLAKGEAGYCGLAALEPKDNKADDLAPLLSWQKFPRESDLKAVPEDMKKVKNVRYELFVATGDNGETPDVVYRAEDLKETSHKLSIGLNPNTRYFWSVRARFDLNGRQRVTEWASYCPFGRQLVVGGRIYRFYTPKVGRGYTESWVKGPL